MFCERRHMKSCEGFSFWFVVSRNFLNCFFEVFVWIVVTCWGVLVLLHVFIWCRVGCGSGRVLIMCLYFLLVFAKANLWSRSGCAISLMYGFFIAWVRLFMKDVNDLDTLCFTFVKVRFGTFVGCICIRVFWVVFLILETMAWGRAIIWYHGLSWGAFFVKFFFLMWGLHVDFWHRIFKM